MEKLERRNLQEVKNWQGDFPRKRRPVGEEVERFSKGDIRGLGRQKEKDQ